MNIRYFDHAATTSVRPEVLKAMLPYFGIEYGNPSSQYSLGRKNRKIVEENRAKIAKAINCDVNEIYFTSCGSESDNLALKGIMYANKNKGNHIITSQIEHPAILNTCKSLEKQGFEVTYLYVDENGFINLNELENSIKKNTVLISIMTANNEIGTIQPIDKIGEIAKKHNIIFHTDGVQAIGNVRIDVKKMNIDSLSMSAHKFYGPKGMGALYIKNNVKFDGIQNGGHQEKNKRAGTENVPGIVGIGTAIDLIYREFDIYNNKLKFLRDYYIEMIEKYVKNVKLNGDRKCRLPGNANFSFIGVDATELLFNLDNYGICASSGSACTSGTLEPSHVLTAIGLNEKLSQSALRISLGRENTKEDVDFLIKCIKNIVDRARASG